jgi:hypothetical protein
MPVMSRHETKPQMRMTHAAAELAEPNVVYSLAVHRFETPADHLRTLKYWRDC